MIDYELIRMEMASRGITKYAVKSELVYVDREDFTMDLGRYIWLLVSRKVDIMDYAKVDMISNDNLFTFNKAKLESLEVAGYQFFKGSLEIITENNMTDIDPDDFIPYNLEFLKIIPLNENFTH